MTTGSPLGRMGRCNGGYDEERRWRLLNLLVGVVDAVNERVDEFVSVVV